MEAAFSNQQLVVELLALLLGVIKGVLLGKVIGEARESLPRLSKGLLVLASLLLLGLFLFIKLALIHGKTEVGCSLVQSIVLCLITNLLYDLYARRSCSDLGDPLPFEVHAVLRPDCGVIDVPAEVAQSRDWRTVSSRSEANARDEPPAGDLRLVGALDKPAVCFLVEHGTVDVLVEGGILVHVPLGLNVVEVSAKFSPPGVALLECEVFPKLFVEELIYAMSVVAGCIQRGLRTDWGITVHTCSGIAVPVPMELSAKRFRSKCS